MKTKSGLLLTTFSSLLITFTLHAQKENNIWYFGKNAGLDFNSGAPVPLTNGAMNTWEGCASVADGTTGSLLFYSDGSSVWNSSHVTMPNGFGLWGDESSSQSALIVPKPGSATLYYLFTTDAGTNGLPHGGKMAYSIVDMSLAGGLGDITLKNVALFDTTSEQQTATLNANGCSVWVLAHRWNSDEFYAYLVSDTGISTPVISSSGSIHNCAYFGQIKISRDGRHLALPLPCDAAGNSFVELFDFDTATGIVSNGVQMPQDHLVYGVEFSPNSNYLYVVDHNNSSAIIYKQVAQYNVSLGSSAAINASRIIVGIVWNTTTFFNGSAQLAPDGKIYVVPTDKDSLCVINDPDSAGLACNFVVPGIYLGGPQNDHGLPNIVVKANYPCAPPTSLFTATNHICPGTCTNFTNLSINATNYDWTFAGASPSTSTDVNPANICYNTPGNYSVSLVATNVNGSDTLTLNNFITVYSAPAPQGIAQSGDTLFANQGAISYQWYHDGNIIAGATDYFYIATEGGDYNLVATDANSCQVEAAIFDVVAGLPTTIDGLEFMVFPNPVRNKLTISSGQFAQSNPSSGGLAINAITLYSILGEKVIAVSLPKANCKQPAELDLRALPNGVYYLQLSGSTYQTQTFKVVVQH